MVRIQLTDEGAYQVGDAEEAVLHIRFVGSTTELPIRAVRVMHGTPLATEFLFMRSGEYRLRLHAVEPSKWPADDATGRPIDGCSEQAVRVHHQAQKEFAGVRAHGWVSLRLLTSVEAEVGSSVFIGRLGIAGVLNVPAFGDPLNRWISGLDLRWRGARGYLGGGLRYFPKPEADRDRLRPLLVSGQELPPFKGLPVWFQLDIRVDEYHRAFWKGLDLSFGVRLDLTKNRQ
jgi:hypothetical protein